MPEIDSTLLLIDTQEEDLVTGLSGIGIELRPDFCQTLRVSVSENSNSPNSCADGPLEISRTYTVSDDFFSYDCIQEIRVLRPIAPTISNQAQNFTADCGIELDAQFQDWIANNANLMIEGCSEPYSFSTDPANPTPPSCNEPIDITFIARDDCDNEFISTATFILEDNDAPLLACPDPLSVDPTDNQLEEKINQWLDSVVATDDCTTAAPTNDFNTDTLSPDCDVSQEIEVNFETVDGCGNTSSCVTTLSVQGLTAPALNCGPDLPLVCTDDRLARFDDWIEVFNAVDGNGQVLDITNNLDQVALADLECNEELSVLFSIVDDCGRPLDCLRFISVSDNVDPELSCPPALEVSSSDAEAIEKINTWIDSYSAQDDCDPDLSISNDYMPVSDLCAVTEDINVIYTAEDACSNSATCTTMLSVLSENAVINCPSRLTLECGESSEEEIIDWIALAEATGNQGNPIINDFAGLDDFIGCSEPIEVTFSTSSECGGPADCVGIIEIVDTRPPVINCPGQLEIDLLVANDVSLRVETWLEQATASDCNSFELSHDFTQDIEALSCGGAELVQFTAIDECGLTSSCESNLVLLHEATLTIECPEPLTLICTNPRLDLEIANHLNNVTVQADIDYELSTDMDTEAINNDCLEITQVEVDVIAIDACGNEASCSITLEIQPDPQIYIPNVISPDGDGLNDYFNVFGNASIDIVKTMIIYNRWGDKVFYSENIAVNDDQAGWDGRFNQTDEASQVFTYYVEVKTMDGNTITKAGSIQVLR